MKRRIMAAIGLLIMMCALAGCQLAREDAGADAGVEDRLIGLFVTTDYLDLFDFDRYIVDNIGELGEGDVEIGLEGDERMYQGRLYASMPPETYTGEASGEAVVFETYVFEGVEGFSFFAPTVPATDTRESYVSSVIDPAINDTHVHIKSEDDADSMELSGTIYACPSPEKYTYYYNPVYQDAAGGVYVMSGSGFTVSHDMVEGALFSQKSDSSTTTSENGRAFTQSTSVTLGIDIMYSPERIVVLQMDDEGGVLLRGEYSPGTVPEAITPEPETAYFIVETYRQDPEGEVSTVRELYDRGDTGFHTFAEGAGGVCMSHWTRIDGE